MSLLSFAKLILLNNLGGPELTNNKNGIRVVGNQYFTILVLLGFVVNLKKCRNINNIICRRLNVKWYCGTSKVFYSLTGFFLGLFFQFF